MERIENNMQNAFGTAASLTPAAAAEVWRAGAKSSATAAQRYGMAARRPKQDAHALHAAVDAAGITRPNCSGAYDRTTNELK
ncbi:hypothetical protein LJC45_04115 [Alistipes sp. OttesenSCG-928-B03]|nr:hypothetical protein [Alistipes sp. OttesenSCG-928-B03]